ncbi:permease [Longibacter salinarum]|uniref:Permease n=1 Tax=Longibacter salinarum TaxID=1850348 RepID=A0A2A8CYP6_9BACT|nr:Bax inhibitor-1 family protein [Longibacter salinarum]PEN13518.1 permease [Longibacter salinarum]
MPDSSPAIDASQVSWTPVADLDTSTRAAFIWQTYLHVAAAIIGFALLEVFLFSSGLAEPIAQAMLSVNWLIPLGAFMVVGWLATRTAHRTESISKQYLALAGFVVAEAILFVPLLVMAHYTAGGGVIESAAWVTLLGFAGLTGIAFYTRKDFSFLRGVMIWGGFAALGLIVAGSIFGFQLGTFFSIGMVALAGASILYDTSNVIHHFPKDRYVAAALQLFASVAMMFWYILSLMSSE